MASEKDIIEQNMKDFALEDDSANKDDIDVTNDLHSTSEDDTKCDSKDINHHDSNGDISQEQDSVENTHLQTVTENIDNISIQYDENISVSSKEKSTEKNKKESKWKRLRKTLFNKNKAKPTQRKVDSTLQSKASSISDVSKSEQSDQFDTQVDLRSIPLSIDQYDTGYNKQLKLTSVLAAVQKSGKHKITSNSILRAKREEEQFRRQEEALKAYTTVYDLLTDKMVSYYELERRKNGHFNVFK